LRIGIAEIDYTPEAGLPLMGNFRSDYAARGVHDPLRARALVFEDAAGTRAAILSIDICMLDRAGVALVRDTVRSRCGLSPEHLLVAATHTHSGPAAMRLGSLPKAGDASIARFLSRAAEAVASALDDLRETTLKAGAACEPGLSFNRRLLCTDGLTRMNWERPDPATVVAPRGPIDPHLAVLALERQGRPDALAVNFGLHPAILAGDNWLYSADYPGYLAEAVRRLLGEHVATVFWNGCSGNVNHLDYRDPAQGRGFKEAQRVGYALAVGAVGAVHAAQPVACGPVLVSREMVELTRLRIEDDEARRYREILARTAGTSPGQVDGLPEEYYAATRLAMYEKQDQPDRVEVMAIRLGDVAVVGLPGEVFCELGMDLRRRSPAPHTFLIELANDAIGYLPTREAFDEGGYEPTPGATFYTPDAGEALIASALRQLERLYA